MCSHKHTVFKLFFLTPKLRPVSVMNLMDFSLAPNLTNPILSHEERRLYRSTGPPNLSHRLKFLKKYLTKGVIQYYFLPGPTEWNCSLSAKKWMMTGVRRGWDLRQKLSLCCLSLLQASLTTWIVSRLSNQWFTDQNSTDVPGLTLLTYCTETEHSIVAPQPLNISSYCILEHKTDTQRHQSELSAS